MQSEKQSGMTYAHGFRHKEVSTTAWGYYTLYMRGAITMPQCQTFGNEYDNDLKVVLADVSYTFDSFECGVQALAPSCSQCGCRTLGHGVEADGAMFCCAHCASQQGVRQVRDRA